MARIISLFLNGRLPTSEVIPDIRERIPFMR
jgi:hypothetical protein